MSTYKVSYGTIRDMEVHLPEQFDAFDLINCFAKSYVKHATSQSLVSDEVLFSSIGSSHVRKAMILGVQERIKDESTLNIFKDVIDSDAFWKQSVLRARYGVKEGARKFFRLQGISEDRIEEFIGNF